MHIALLAGEASGDQLGAELIKSLRKINPCIHFDGVGGPLMQAQDFQSLLPIEDFAVMGITEILKSLPRLLRYRKMLQDHYHNTMPDAFIGIDYPEFNLSLEKRLKANGIYTAHYVSPSVWAWREERIHHIKTSCDLMLTLFDFEKQFYDLHQMPAVYCGHPLVDMIAQDSGTDSTACARQQLEIAEHGHRYLAVLPGSRASEVDKMLPVFLHVMHHLVTKIPDIHFLIPAVTPALSEHIQHILNKKAETLNCHVFLHRGRSVMQAADAVLLASGTAALEAMLLEKPMLVSYKVSGITAMLAKRRLRISHFSLPNLLADHPVVPEFMQDDIDPEDMADTLLTLLTPGDERQRMIRRLRSLRQKIKTHAADNAAKAVYHDMIQRELTG